MNPTALNCYKSVIIKEKKLGKERNWLLLVNLSILDPLLF